MNLEAIAPLALEGAGALPAPATLQQPRKTDGVDFTQWMQTQLDEVNTQIHSSQAGLVQLATGEGGNLHHVMLELEKAKTAFQLTVQVRNKILEGYQEIMRMQI
jgi:flagellar hook-basal body complex protein FliE